MRRKYGGADVKKIIFESDVRRSRTPINPAENKRKNGVRSGRSGIAEKYADENPRTYRRRAAASSSL